MDGALVQRAREGDARAQEELVRLLTPRLLGLALRLSNDPELAEDMVNESLYRGIIKLDRLRDTRAVAAWFRRILVHLWRDRLRARRPRFRSLDELSEEPCCEAPAGRDLDAAELSVRVARAVATLPPMQRAVLALHIDEGLGVGEIAELLAAKPDRVKANLWHARKRLRSLLAADPGIDV